MHLIDVLFISASWLSLRPKTMGFPPCCHSSLQAGIGKPRIPKGACLHAYLSVYAFSQIEKNRSISICVVPWRSSSACTWGVMSWRLLPSRRRRSCSTSTSVRKFIDGRTCVQFISANIAAIHIYFFYLRWYNNSSLYSFTVFHRFHYMYRLL